MYNELFTTVFLLNRTLYRNEHLCSSDNKWTANQVIQYLYWTELCIAINIYVVHIINAQ